MNAGVEHQGCRGKFDASSGPTTGYFGSLTPEQARSILVMHHPLASTWRRRRAIEGLLIVRPLAGDGRKTLPSRAGSPVHSYPPLAEQLAEINVPFACRTEADSSDVSPSRWHSRHGREPSVTRKLTRILRRTT